MKKTRSWEADEKVEVLSSGALSRAQSCSVPFFRRQAIQRGIVLDESEPSQKVRKHKVKLSSAKPALTLHRGSVGKKSSSSSVGFKNKKSKNVDHHAKEEEEDNVNIANITTPSNSEVEESDFAKRRENDAVETGNIIKRGKGREGESVKATSSESKSAAQIVAEGIEQWKQKMIGWMNKETPYHEFQRVRLAASLQGQEDYKKQMVVSSKNNSFFSADELFHQHQRSLFLIGDIVNIIASFLDWKTLRSTFLYVNRCCGVAATWRTLERNGTTILFQHDAELHENDENGGLKISSPKATAAKESHVRSLLGFFSDVPLRFSARRASATSDAVPVLQKSNGFLKNPQLSFFSSAPPPPAQVTVRLHPALIHPCAFSDKPLRCEVEPRPRFLQQSQKRSIGNLCRIQHHTPTAGQNKLEVRLEVFMSIFLHLCPFPSVFFDSTKHLPAPISSSTVTCHTFAADPRSSSYFSHMRCASDTPATVLPFLIQALRYYAPRVKVTFWSLPCSNKKRSTSQKQKEETERINDDDDGYSTLIPIIPGITVAEWKWVIKIWLELEVLPREKHLGVPPKDQRQQPFLYILPPVQQRCDLLCAALTLVSGPFGVLPDYFPLTAAVLEQFSSSCHCILEIFGKYPLIFQESDDTDEDEDETCEGVEALKLLNKEKNNEKIDAMLTESFCKKLKRGSASSNSSAVTSCYTVAPSGDLKFQRSLKQQWVIVLFPAPLSYASMSKINKKDVCSSHSSLEAASVQVIQFTASIGYKCLELVEYLDSLMLKEMTGNCCLPSQPMSVTRYFSLAFWNNNCRQYRKKAVAEISSLQSSPHWEAVHHAERYDSLSQFNSHSVHSPSLAIAFFGVTAGCDEEFKKKAFAGQSSRTSYNKSNALTSSHKDEEGWPNTYKKSISKELAVHCCKVKLRCATIPRTAHIALPLTHTYSIHLLLQYMDWLMSHNRLSMFCIAPPFQWKPGDSNTSKTTEEENEKNSRSCSQEDNDGPTSCPQLVEEQEGEEERKRDEQKLMDLFVQFYRIEGRKLKVSMDDEVSYENAGEFYLSISQCWMRSQCRGNAKDNASEIVGHEEDVAIVIRLPSTM